MRRGEYSPIQRVRLAGGAPIREGSLSSGANLRELGRVVGRCRGLGQVFFFTAVLADRLPALLRTRERTGEPHPLTQRLSLPVDARHCGLQV